MTEKEREIKAAYLCGKDARERGANPLNAAFHYFSSPQKMKAWEFGNQGKPYSLTKILKAAL